MTNPFTTVSDTQKEAGDRIYLPIRRCKGKLLIARPLEYQKEGFKTEHAPDGTDVVFCDFALLDPISPAQDEEGNDLPGFPAGQQFRGQSVLQGYLKGTFKRYVGNTLIGTIYFGPKTKGKPPIMWMDLSGDAACVQRGQQFLAAHPEFLVPVQAAFSETTPEVWTGAPSYTQPAGNGGGGGQYNPHDAKAPVGSTLDAMRTMLGRTPDASEPPF